MTPLLELVHRKLQGIEESGTYVGDDIVVIARDHILESLHTLRHDPAFAFDMLSDLTVVDYIGQEPRFELVYHLYSLEHGHRLRVKVPIPDGDDCWAPTATRIWKAANWAEREAWDLYGVRFQGHPDLRRILMYEEFVGHPLRKDYPQNGRQPLLRRPDAPTTDDQTTRLLEGSHERNVS